MTDKNLFEIAARTKLRVSSSRGPLSMEQLWDVPLRSKDDFNLDVIAKSANAELKSVSDVSFVDQHKNPDEARAALRLDVVKYVIESKLADEAAAAARAERKVEREKLVKILNEKQSEELLGLSAKELQKRIASLTD